LASALLRQLFGHRAARFWWLHGLPTRAKVKRAAIALFAAAIPRNWRAILTQTICRCSDNAKLPVFSSHPLGDLEEEPGEKD